MQGYEPISSLSRSYYFVRLHRFQLFAAGLAIANRPTNMEPTEDHHNTAESHQLLKSHVSLRATSIRSHRASVAVASDQTLQGSDKNGELQSIPSPRTTY